MKGEIEIQRLRLHPVIERSVEEGTFREYPQPAQPPSFLLVRGVHSSPSRATTTTMMMYRSSRVVVAHRGYGRGDRSRVQRGETELPPHHLLAVDAHDQFRSTQVRMRVLDGD